MSVASYDTENKTPYLDATPDIMLGKGKFRIDTTHFSEDEFKMFIEEKGITYPKTTTMDRKIDLSKPPTAMFHRGGREPIERDPRKLRKNAKLLWKKFTILITQRKTQQEKVIDLTEQPSMMPSAAPTTQKQAIQINHEPKITELEAAMKAMRDSHVTVTAMQNKMKEQIQATEDLFTPSMNRIAQNMKYFQKHQIEFAMAQQQTNVTMPDFQQRLVIQSNQIVDNIETCIQ